MATATARRQAVQNGPTTAGVPLSNTEAVTQALAALGHAATPKALAGWIRQNLGIEMLPNMAGTYKSKILRGQIGGQAARRTTPRTPAVGTGGSNYTMQELTAFRSLCDQLGGIGRVKELADTFHAVSV